MTDEDLDNGTFGGSVGLSAACWNRTFATFSAEDILHCRCCVARLKQFRQGRGDDSTTVQCFAGSGWKTHAFWGVFRSCHYWQIHDSCVCFFQTQLLCAAIHFFHRRELTLWWSVCHSVKCKVQLSQVQESWSQVTFDRMPMCCNEWRPGQHLWLTIR